MPLPYGVQHRDDLLWDIGRFNFRGDIGRGAGKLTTAVGSYGVFQLTPQGANAYIYSIRVSADAPTQWWMLVNAPVSGLTNGKSVAMRGWALLGGFLWQYGLAAAPLVDYTYGTGFLAAGQQAEAMAPAMLSCDTTFRPITLVFNQVAANVACIFDWLVMSD
jgi:hypothetical protein